MKHTKPHPQIYDGLEKAQYFKPANANANKSLPLASLLGWIVYILFSATLFIGCVWLSKKFRLVPDIGLLLAVATGSGLPFLVVLWLRSFFSNALYIDGRHLHLTFPDTNQGFSNKSITAEPARILFSTRNLVIVKTRWWRITGLPRLWQCTDGKTENTTYEISTRGRRLVLQLNLLGSGKVGSE